MSDVSKGGCLCGAVRFHTEAPLREVIFCHCSQCRRQTGLYYAATSVPWDSLTLETADTLRWYASSAFARRGFCGTCGSALFWKAETEANVAILAGAFDDGTPLRPGAHIFVADMGCFYTVPPDQPQFARDAPGIVVDGA